MKKLILTSILCLMTISPYANAERAGIHRCTFYPESFAFENDEQKREYNLLGFILDPKLNGNIKTMVAATNVEDAKAIFINRLNDGIILNYQNENIDFNTVFSLDAVWAEQVSKLRGYSELKLKLDGIRKKEDDSISLYLGVYGKSVTNGAHSLELIQHISKDSLTCRPSRH